MITPADWKTTVGTGAVPLAPIDELDGYVHLSSKADILETAGLYFDETLAPFLLKISTQQLGDALIWEVVDSRGGTQFPHLYGGPIPVSAIVATVDIVWGTGTGPTWGEERPFQSTGNAP